MVYVVEAWTIHRPDDEEPSRNEMAQSEEFEDEHDAMLWAWDRLEEGFDVRMYQR